MLTQPKTQDVTISGFDGFGYKAEMNAEMFDLLINKMYSNKIQAVLRELGANAVDAHIMANNHNGFDLHLPSVQEPYFSIRDYGIGLDGEEIRELYTTLGASSKRQTNNQIGCIGIGSKCPFAYTNKFFITSYKNGIKYSYLAYIDDDKMPKMAIFSEAEPTQEPNGVEVKFNIIKTGYELNTEINNFTNEAMEVFEFFKIKPNNFTPKKVEYEFDFGDIKLRNEINKSIYRYNYSTNYVPRIIMGGIKYSWSHKFAEIAAGLPIDLFFEIGELDVAGNREELEYNDRTIACIRKKLEKAHKLISDKVSENINNCSCEFDAFLESKKYQAYKVRLSYKGKEIRTNFKKDTNYRIISFYNGNKAHDGKNINLSNMQCLLFFNDLAIGGIARCQEYSKVNQNKYIHILFCDKKEADTLIINIGLSPSYLNKVSSLNKPTRKAYNKNIFEAQKYSSRSVYSDEFNSSLFRYWKSLDTFDKKTGGYYYVIYDRGKFINGEKREHPAYIKHMCHILNIKEDLVYGFKKDFTKDLKGQDLVELFKKSIANNKNNYIFTYDKISKINNLKYFNSLKEISQYSKEIQNFLKLNDSLPKIDLSISTSLRILNNITPIKEPSIPDISGEYNKIIKKYPLINHLTPSKSKEVQEIYENYFKGIGI